LELPYFIYRRDSIYSDGTQQVQLVTDKLKASGLYNDHLLFTGIKGVSLYKQGTYGKRDQTYAVSEDAFIRSVSEKRRDRKFFQNPFMYMDDEGKSMPGLAVFDASKLVCGRFYHEPEPNLPKNDEILWWTPDGSSLDTAAVAVFFFKKFDSTKLTN
jgi:hypothetical protein